MGYSIAIDGPAGAGKSTIARSIAGKLGFIYVDTGAMYRAMGLYFMEQGIKDEAIIKEVCQKVSILISYERGEQQVILNEENVNARIRDEEVGKMASFVAKIKEVRLKLVDLQRELAKSEKVVMDGRDIGTYVLPQANVKIYLTASSKIRAGRRYKELLEKGITCNFDEIEEEIKKRDAQDMNREFAPLKQAEDAILVDTSYLTKEEVEDKIISIYKEIYAEGNFS